jgi:hypothetical protein
MRSISGCWAAAIRLASSITAGAEARLPARSAISTACRWWVIMSVAKLTSAWLNDADAPLELAARDEPIPAVGCESSCPLLHPASTTAVMTAALVRAQVLRINSTPLLDSLATAVVPAGAGAN